MINIFDPHIIAAGILHYEYILIAAVHLSLFSDVKVTNNGPKVAMLNNAIPSEEIPYNVCNVIKALIFLSNKRLHSVNAFRIVATSIYIISL